MKLNGQRTQDEFYQLELRKAIRIKSGKRIVEFNECCSLSEYFLEIGIPLSAHTIARFFGVLKTKHHPYRATLDLLCQYVGYDSWSTFCSTISENLNSALFSPREAFSYGNYSLVAFELAIAENDWITVNDLLESVNLNDPFTYELVMYLGSSVRRHPNKKDFLHALSQSKSGRWFFYECFVDEDDENNYYSEALLTYYSKSPIPLGNQIFIKCFLAVKSIYAGTQIHERDFKWIQLDGISFDQLHFHEISRILELRILLDFIDKSLDNNKLLYHLDLVCELSQKMPHFNASWVLARTIKALSFSDKFKLAMDYEPFRNVLFKRFHENPTRIHSIGELIIQFVGHSYLLKEKNEHYNLPPIKLSYRHDNETKTRVLVESATALLYAEDPVKQMLEKNLYNYSEKTNQTWINPLIL